MQWSHELRGFRRGNTTGNGSQEESNCAALDHNSDLSVLIWSPFACTVKDQIVSTLTKHQRIDIWDLVGLEETPSYDDAVREKLQPGDPRWLTPEIVKPNRMLFLDGVLQSSTRNTREFHEAMVHPPMFAHPQPKRIAIGMSYGYAWTISEDVADALGIFSFFLFAFVVGGADGATLREVLKHKTVESITMFEKDEELMKIIREAMPIMSNCSDLVGRAENCFEDALVNLVVQDGEWDMKIS